MKRILTILATLYMVGSVMAQMATITLSSGGKLQFFHADQLGAAIDAANPNDTIYLSNGTFTGIPYDEKTAGHYITKPLVIIGSSASTCKISLGEKIYINLNNSDGMFSLEGVYSSNDIWIVSEMNQFKMVNTRVTSLKINSSSPLKSLIIDRCLISSDLVLDNVKDDDIIPVKSAIVRNSFVTNIYDTGEDMTGCTLINCCVKTVRDSFRGYILNSIIERANDLANYNSCYVYQDTPANCTSITWGQFDKYWSQGQYDVANEWIGNDGTVVGVMGGDGPTFSLNPSYPTPDATNSTLEYDKVNKKLKIKVSLIEN